MRTNMSLIKYRLTKALLLDSKAATRLQATASEKRSISRSVAATMATNRDTLLPTPSPKPDGSDYSR